MLGSFKDRVWSNQIDFEGMAAFLRRLYPSKTAACVAADIGLPADSVKKWLNGEVQPNGRAVFALVAAYGPDLLSASLRHAPTWLDATAREAKRADLQSRIETMRVGPHRKLIPPHKNTTSNHVWTMNMKIKNGWKRTFWASVSSALLSIASLAMRLSNAAKQKSETPQ